MIARPAHTAPVTAAALPPAQAPALPLTELTMQVHGVDAHDPGSEFFISAAIDLAATSPRPSTWSLLQYVNGELIGADVHNYTVKPSERKAAQASAAALARSGVFQLHATLPDDFQNPPAGYAKIGYRDATNAARMVVVKVGTESPQFSRAVSAIMHYFRTVPPA